MKVTITFDMDNASFEDNLLMEVTKVLSKAKEKILDSQNTTQIRSVLKDTNGNRIGTVEIMDN